MAYIILNKNNFFNNLDIISNRTKGKDKIALVLKDNAYGHGLLEVAKMAQEYGITKAIVRCQVEADIVEEYFDYILVLNEIPSSASDKIRYTINDIKSISKFAKGTKVELKVDTGMHRNGIAMQQLDDAISEIKKYKLNLEAVFTHHRDADELSSAWFWQNENFKKIKKELSHLKDLRFHSANSASLFRTENFNEDIARVGIVAYGCLDSFNDDGIKPILSLVASKISTRELKKGDKIGYGASCTMQEKQVVSNYDFGYGDGFLRACSDGYTTPNNEKLLGRISMDNSSFLSDKDELVVFDDAREIAKSAKTISYEVLTSLKPYIKKLIH